MRLELWDALTRTWKKFAGSKDGVAHVQSPGDYKHIAASSNLSVGALGTGAVGDHLAKVTIMPATTSPGSVTIKDGALGNITLFPGGATSVASLAPITSEVAMTSANGGLAIATGANVSVLASGKFTP